VESVSYSKCYHCSLLLFFWGNHYRSVHSSSPDILAYSRQWWSSRKTERGRFTLKRFHYCGATRQFRLETYQDVQNFPFWSTVWKDPTDVDALCGPTAFAYLWKLMLFPWSYSPQDQPKMITKFSKNGRISWNSTLIIMHLFWCPGARFKQPVISRF
jgi:hypothetical protein